MRARRRETVDVKDRSIARVTGLIEHGDDDRRAQRPRWHGQGRVAEAPHGVNNAAGRTARRHAAGCLGANIARGATNNRTAAASPGVADVVVGAHLSVAARRSVGDVEDGRAMRWSTAVDATRRLEDLTRGRRLRTHLLMTGQRPRRGRRHLGRGQVEEAGAGKEQ